MLSVHVSVYLNTSCIISIISKPCFFSFSSVQHCPYFRCVPRCLRCLPTTTVEAAAATCPCPTTTRSFCSTPSIRVSWSLAESRARSEGNNRHNVHIIFNCSPFAVHSLHIFKCFSCLCHRRRGSGMMLMGNSLM